MSLQNGEMSNGKDSSKESFLKKNKSLVFMLPLLAVLAAVLVLVYTGVLNFGGTGQPPAKTAETAAVKEESVEQKSTEAKVEVLPQTERSNEEKEEVKTAVTKDPFKSPMLLKGILLKDGGENYAIIDTNGSSYVVKVDDMVAGTWKVTTIDVKSVALESKGQTVTLELSDTKTTDTQAK